MSSPDAGHVTLFRRAVLTVSSGEAFVQLLGIATAPLTARVFSPAQAGLGGVATSLIAIVAGAAAFRYELGIGIPRTRTDRLRLLVLSLLLAAAMAVILLAVVLAFRHPIARLLGLESAPFLLLLLPLGVALGAGFNALTQWHGRERNYGIFARTRLVQSVVQISLQLGGGVLSGGRSLALVAGFVAGHGVAFGRLALGAASELRTAVRSATWHDLKELAREYRRFPLYSSWAALLDSVSPSLPLFIMASRFGPDEGGYVRMAHALVLLPVAALSTGITTVYRAEAARLATEDPRALWRLYRGVTLRLSLAGLALIAGSLLLPVVVPWALGARWATAGTYGITMALPAAGALVASAATNLSLLGRNGWEAAWIVARLGLVAGGAAVAGGFGVGAGGMLLVMAVALLAGYVVLVWLNRVAIARHVRQADVDPDKRPSGTVPPARPGEGRLE